MARPGVSASDGALLASTLIDGVPVNEMRIGGYIDFAHLATDRLDRIDQRGFAGLQQYTQRN